MSLQSQIAAIVPTMDGWCSPEKANDLAMAVIKLRSAVSVEIGVFAGRSAIPIALAHAEQSYGILWAIDAWDKKASTENQTGVNSDWWGNVDHEMMYQRFLAQLKVQGVENFVKVIRSRSDDVDPPKEIDFLHIDGDHSEQSVRDVTRFASRVKAGGFCFCDDVGWSNLGPARAVEKLITMGFVKLFKRDDGEMFQRAEAPIVAKKRGRGPNKKKRKK